MEFPSRNEDLISWVQATPPADVHTAVLHRLSTKDPQTGQARLATYLTEEDVQLLVVFLRMGAKRGDLTWEDYFRQERAVLDQGNLRMGLATGQVQHIENENGTDQYETRIPVPAVHTDAASYILRGALLGHIVDDGANVRFHLQTFAGSFPVANADYTIEEKTGDVDIERQVDKAEDKTWLDARAAVFQQFHDLYEMGDKGVRSAVARVEPPHPTP